MYSIYILLTKGSGNEYVFPHYHYSMRIKRIFLLQKYSESLKLSCLFWFFFLINVIFFLFELFIVKIDKQKDFQRVTGRALWKILSAVTGPRRTCGLTSSASRGRTSFTSKMPLFLLPHSIRWFSCAQKSFEFFGCYG